jgi:hypothetical protein
MTVGGVRLKSERKLMPEFMEGNRHLVQTRVNLGENCSGGKFAGSIALSGAHTGKNFDALL